MWKNIRPFKVRRFKVETTFDGVEMSAVCRIVANTMTVTITKPHYEVMLRKHKLTEIVFEYVKQIVLWIIHNEEEAKKLIDAHNKEQAMVQAWLNSDSNTTWEEWLNRHPEM
jgi:hypothetical protein